MKVAIVYNHENAEVINLFGVPNREKYGLLTIKQITESLKVGGHTVQAFEGDKGLIGKLERFMPKVLKHERPGMVFNLSYGIQGQARYTHVPSILEMVGIPYVGSGPLAHSLALDKVVAKVLFKQKGVPTPDFIVLENAQDEIPTLKYPMIVKPKHEAVSYGIKIVTNPQDLKQAAQAIFDKYGQAVLAESYIEGREINVGVIGNSPAEALPPVELVFGEGGPPIFTYEDKAKVSGREIRQVCPAEFKPELTKLAQKTAVQAFKALGCFDCARIDMRIGKDGQLYVLEINSLPSLGPTTSFVCGAQAAGLDFTGLMTRLIEVASARYFGTPKPPAIQIEKKEPRDSVFSYITERRDIMERRLKEWVTRSSRTTDPLGLQSARKHLGGVPIAGEI